MYCGIDDTMGPSTFVDVTVWNPCSSSVLAHALQPVAETGPGTHRQGGGCANYAESHKRRRAARLLNGRICPDQFWPLALEVYGAQGEATATILRVLRNHSRRRPNNSTGVNWAAPSFAPYADQRLSIALQRGLHAQTTRQAARIRGTPRA